MTPSDSSLTAQRKALSIALSSVPRVDYAPPLYRQMFQEDVQLTKLFTHPIRGGERTLRLEGSEEDLKRVNSLCTRIGGGRHFRPEDNVADAIGHVLMYLAHYGEALFWIMEEEGGPVPSVSHFYADYAWRLPHRYVLVAPRRRWPDLSKKYVILRKSDVWRIEIPSVLGGVRGYRRILDGLSSFPSLGPEFFQDDLQRRQLNIEFNFTDYRRAERANLYSVTREWGWSGRDWSADYATEFYRFHRHFTFKWAKAVLREHLINEFNLLFLRLGISAEIVVDGLSSPGEILEVRKNLGAGLVDFAGASKAVQ
jgi:hypothetical protein